MTDTVPDTVPDAETADTAGLHRDERFETWRASIVDQIRAVRPTSARAASLSPHCPTCGSLPAHQEVGRAGQYELVIDQPVTDLQAQVCLDDGQVEFGFGFDKNSDPIPLDLFRFRVTQQVAAQMMTALGKASDEVWTPLLTSGGSAAPEGPEGPSVASTGPSEGPQAVTEPASVATPGICHPDQCCGDGYCVIEYGLHGVTRDVAEQVVEHVGDHINRLTRG